MRHEAHHQGPTPSATAGDLRITGIETLAVNAEMRTWLFVKVLTNEDGLYGWGEASLNWKTRAVIGTVEDLAPLVIGMDPRDISRVLEVMFKHSYYRLGIIGASAVSGIEHALWDIFGKSVGLPVWRLLGGKVRDKVRVYGHLGMGKMDAVYRPMEDSARLADDARAVLAHGYDALKVLLVPYCGYLPNQEDLRRTDRLMSALRDAVGPDVDLMVDFHGRPGSVAAALQFIEVLAPYNPMFCEEPLPPENSDALKIVADRSPVPIATGERLIGLSHFIPILDRHSVHVVQPDLNHTGGLLEGKRIAALAAAQLAGVAPHNPNGPIAGAAALHFAVSTPNFVIQEEMSGAVPWYDEVFHSPMKRQGSFWEVPDAPGLGVEVNEEEARKHPFRQEVITSRSAVLKDGSTTRW